MKTTLILLGGVLLSFFISSYQSVPFGNENISGTWKSTWTNKAVSNDQSTITWQINEDGTGFEIDSITSTSGAFKKIIVTKFPIEWKINKTKGGSFINIRYNPGETIFQSFKGITETNSTDSNPSNPLLQLKKGLMLNIQYYYYGNNMLYVNDFLDGSSITNTKARTRFEKVPVKNNGN